MKTKGLKNVAMSIVAIVLTLTSFELKSQSEGWKLPKVDGSIQFDYKSNPYKIKKRELCSYYADPSAQSEIPPSLNSKIDGKGSSLFTYKGYTASVILLNVDGMDQMKILKREFCNLGQPDTVYGNLSMFVRKMPASWEVFNVTAGATIKCKYRIIFYEDHHFEITYKGFLVTTQTYKKAPAKFDTEEKFLDDLYDEEKASNKMKGFYKDLKMMVNMYNEVLTEFFDRRIKSEF